MAEINVKAVPNNTNVTVQDANNLNVNISGGNKINLEVTPVAPQIIQINRGVQGQPGNNDIGGYPVIITNAKKYDVLMFDESSWVNTPQTEITDGGNF